MPELPEVEVTRRGLLPHLPGKKITDVKWSGKRLRLPIPRKLLKESIKGQRIQTIDRRAKYLLFRMHNNSVLVLHLGMTGKVGLFPHKAAGARHDHLRMQLNNGMEMRFNDTRRFGAIIVWPAEQAEELEREFSATKGLEPFDSNFTATSLQRLAEKRRQPIKTFLMDSRLLAGIGNIYANEILFAASIAPDIPVNQITADQWQAIVTHCREILTRAIKAGGSTISDFIGSSGHQGYFQLQLNVYGKEGEPCPTCQTTIRKKILGGRATFWCPTCQHG